MYDVVQQLAQPEDPVLDRFGIDVLDVGLAFNTEDSAWYDVTTADGCESRQLVTFPGPERRPRTSSGARPTAPRSPGSEAARSGGAASRSSCPTSTRAPSSGWRASSEDGGRPGKDVGPPARAGSG